MEINENKINVWILNHYASTMYINRQGRHYSFAKNFIQNGMDVTVFAASSLHGENKNMISDSKKFIEKNVDGIPFVLVKCSNYKKNDFFRIVNIFQFFFRILSVSKKRQDKPDVILASSVHPLSWVAGLILSKRYNAKFIAESRDLWPEVLVQLGKYRKSSLIIKLMYKLEKYIYEKSDKYIFTMPGGKDYISKKGLDSKKSIYINNGVDLDLFYKNGMEFKLEDKDIEAEGKFNVTYVGAIGKANCMMPVLKAAKLLKEQGKTDIQFIIFGNGYEKENLIKYKNDNKLDNVFIKNAVKRKYIPYILSKSDLNIISFNKSKIYEYGISTNKLFEYLASAKPVLWNVEMKNNEYNIVEKYNCGITVKGDSHIEIAEGILEIYNLDRNKYLDYCENAKRTAKVFDYKVLSDKLINTIKEII